MVVSSIQASSDRAVGKMINLFKMYLPLAINISVLKLKVCN